MLELQKCMAGVKSQDEMLGCKKQDEELYSENEKREANFKVGVVKFRSQATSQNK